MPSFGGNPGNRAPAPSQGLGGIGQIAGQAAHAVQTAAPPVAHAAAHVVNSVPHAYRQAIVHTFDHQSSTTQASILRGAIRLARSGGAPAEAHIVLQHVAQSLGPDPFSLSVNQLNRQGAIRSSVFGPGSRPGIKTDPSQKMSGGGGVLGAIGGTIGDAASGIGDAAKFAYSLSNPQRLTNPGLSQPDGPPALQLARQGAAAVGKGLQALPLSNKGPGGVQTAGMTQGQFVKNLGKDVVNLYAEALPSIAIPISQAIGGHPGQALSTVVQPYQQIIKDPVGMALQHPGLTAAAVGAPLHGATRAVSAPVRALAPDSALGKAVGTQRPGVALTGNLTHERVPYSPSPTLKMSQVSIDRSLYKRAPNGQLVPRSNFARDKLIRHGVAQVFSARELIRRANRTEVQVQRQKAIAPSIPTRAAHAVTTAASYNPPRAAIPGAQVLARIADTTIRRPDTFVQDLKMHLAQVSATRPNLLDSPKLLKEHDAYVKTIRQAIDHPPTGKALTKLFSAADKYRQDYAPAQARAHQLGHFGDMTGAALQRRELMHYAVTHMGARMDETRIGLDPNAPMRGLTVDRPNPAHAVVMARAGKVAAMLRGATTAGEKKAAQIALAKVQGKFRDHPPTLPHQLSNADILAHLNGPQGTGGRLPAFTSDKPSSGSAFYVSGERRPLPVTAKNTLFAYTHGLTDPTHEALLHQHLQMQGVVDAHHSQNEYLNTLAQQKSTGGYWSTYKQAAADAPHGYVPVNVSQPFHSTASLDQAMKDTHPALLEEEAARRSLDLGERLRPDSPGGRWAVIDKHALNSLKEQQGMISPNTAMRVFRGANTLFRQTALGTSAKHIPGVASENLIRDISYGIGFRSWMTGHRVLSKAVDLHPSQGKDIRSRLTGGQVAGMTDFGRTHSVAETYRGTNMYPVLKAFEATMKAPGPRQIGTAWKAWSHLVIQGTKHVLEEQHQIAAVGKQALGEHGYAKAAKTQGLVGAVSRLTGLHGQMLEDAARGLFDPAKARQYRAGINRMYGTWTDLTPTGRTALMFSPFGMWWWNSVKFLARMPLDQPVKTGLLASATMGTEKQRQAMGLDMFAPNALPGYQQGAIPGGPGKVIAQNYYSPFGVMNNPLETIGSLWEPWMQSALLGSVGVNWLGKPLTSPDNPRGTKKESLPNEMAQRAQYILDSALSSFLPLYTKAKQVSQGGASAYDVSGNSPIPNLLKGKAPATKTPGKGIAAGLSTTLKPYRSYKTTPKSGAPGWGFSGGSSSGGSSSGSGWNFGGAAPSSSGGWKFQ